MARTPFKIDKNGTKYYVDYTCRKCGGAGGADAWKFTGWTCYRCGGSGQDPKPQVWKEYTPEYSAKLQARREARQQKKLMVAKAEAPQRNQEFFRNNAFTPEGKTYFILGKTYDIKEQLKAEGAKWDSFTSHWRMDHPFEGYAYLELSVEDLYGADEAGIYHWDLTESGYFHKVEEAENNLKATNSTSEYIGSEGERLTITATYTHSAGFESEFGTKYIHSFKDENGNEIIWKSTNYIEQDYNTKFSITGTVKGYKEYKGIKQTILTRCKLQEVK